MGATWKLIRPEWHARAARSVARQGAGPGCVPSLWLGRATRAEGQESIFVVCQAVEMEKSNNDNKRRAQADDSESAGAS